MYQIPPQTNNFDILLTQFAQEVHFRSKTEKVNITIVICVLELVYVPNFKLNSFKFSDQICPRNYFQSKKVYFSYLNMPRYQLST